jgi:hypothetical protein
MISKCISTSLKINGVSEFAQLLFTWIIPHTDDFGRIDGDARVIKAIVMPLSERKSDDFSDALLELAKAELILWYRLAGKSIVQVVEFSKHQHNLNKRTESSYAEFNDKECENFLDILRNSKNFSEIPGNSKKVQRNLTEPNLTELNLTRTEPNLTAQARWWVERFHDFYSAYPRKRSKGQAERAWEKVGRALGPTEQLLLAILQGLERAKMSEEWRKDDGRYIPYPATWLTAKGWEDENVTRLPVGADRYLNALIPLEVENEA